MLLGELCQFCEYWHLPLYIRPDGSDGPFRLLQTKSKGRRTVSLEVAILRPSSTIFFPSLYFFSSCLVAEPENIPVLYDFLRSD